MEEEIFVNMSVYYLQEIFIHFFFLSLTAVTNLFFSLRYPAELFFEVSLIDSHNNLDPSAIFRHINVLTESKWALRADWKHLIVFVSIFK